MYGIMDAYSRFIIHLFVGLSNRTLIAVRKYYLMAVMQYGFPHQIRTDKGSETLLMAECQMRFREAEEGQEFAVSDCHLFGTSVRNIRIKSWWARLVSAQIGPWREMFLSYVKTGDK